MPHPHPLGWHQQQAQPRCAAASRDSYLLPIHCSSQHWQHRWGPRAPLNTAVPKIHCLTLTALAIEFGFPRKVTTVPKLPAWELAYRITPRLSRHPSWLLQVTVSAQSTQNTEESEANFPIASFSRHQPRASLFALPRAAPHTPEQTEISAQQGSVQPSHWSCATFNRAARQQSVGN